MDILKTASVGLLESEGRHYMQVIMPPGEDNYFIEITVEDARLFSKRENIEIASFGPLHGCVIFNMVH